MKSSLTVWFLLITLCCFSQISTNSSIPFTLEDNCIYFYCKVNQVDSVKFLFDTGADGSVLNQQSLSKIPVSIDGKELNQGSNGVNEVEVSSKNEIQFGSIVHKNCSFMIIPFGESSFDGIIGTDLMKDYVIEINYGKKVIFFHNKLTEDMTKGYSKLRMFNATYPTYVKSAIQIGNKKYTGFFGLDTGADDALTLASPFVKENNLLEKTTKIGTARSQGSDGSIYEMPVVIVPEVHFASKNLYRVPTFLSNSSEGIDATEELAGFFGNAFLQKFDILFDYQNKQVYFRLNQNLYKEFF